MVRLQLLWDCPKGSVNVFAEHHAALSRMAEAIESPNLMTQRYDADRGQTKTQTYQNIVWYVAVVGYRCTRQGRQQPTATTPPTPSAASPGEPYRWRSARPARRPRAGFRPGSPSPKRSSDTSLGTAPGARSPYRPPASSSPHTAYR